MDEQRELGMPAMQGMLPALPPASQGDLHDRICEVRAACVRIDAKVDRLEAALASIEAIAKRLQAPALLQRRE